MSFTEVTSENWFSRLGGSIKGILFGIVIIPVAVVLLFWNEGREVKRTKTLKEGAQAVVSVSSDTVDSANQDKLVYLTGNVSTEHSITDAHFGLTLKGPIKLDRNVLYYQYEEESETHKDKKLGGSVETTTTYNYTKKWTNSPIDSQKFKDPDYRSSNSIREKIENKSSKPQTVNIGSFTLSDNLWQKISADEKLIFPTDYTLPEALMNKASVANNEIYYGTSATSPSIGDVRVSFTTAAPAEHSLIAQQQGNSFVTYQAKHGTLSVLKKGTHSVDALFAQEASSNRTTSWILRGVGAVLMLFGFNAIFKPLSVVLDVIPFLGNVAEMGTGLVAFILTFCISTTTIAIAWLVYRPLIGCSLLLLVGGAIYWLISLKKKKSITA